MGCILDSGTLLDCENKPVGGALNYVLMYPYEDWFNMKAAGAVTFETDGSISDIVNPAGVQAYRFDQPDATALIPTFPNRKNDGNVDAYDHTFSMTIVGNKQKQKNELDKMQRGLVVAIIMKKNGEGEVYGSDQGLDVIANTAAINDPTLGGVIPVQLASSPRTSAEIAPPASIFKTDIATTKALIDGLVTLGV